MAVHIGEPAVDAVMAEGEPFVVDAQQVKHGGVHVVAVEGIFRSLLGPLVACSVGHSATDASAGEP